MGTVMNGNVWAGACVNGKVVSGLAKNGVVFYKKEQSVYKRRIMVGDNLSYKTIYCDFPENYYQTISEEIGMGNQRQVVISDASTTYIAERNYSPDFEVRVINGIHWQNNIYNYENGVLQANLTSISLENFGSVVTINDNQAYRHIYIEDTNIRPIQVGDKIVPGTKFYGVVPDEPNLNGISTYIYNTNGTAVAYFNFKEGNMINELQVKTDDQYSYTILYSKNPFATVNKSVLTSNTSYTIGEITNQSNPNFNYLLVDTTTLGA